MTSPTIDHDGIEPIVSAPTKMDSSDADVILAANWKEFANHMQISEPAKIQHLAQSCNPKFLRRFFSSIKAIRNLHQAAKLGKSDLMRLLLILGRTNVNKIDKAGQTALHYAAREGHSEIVKMLLEKQNVDASLRDEHGNTALHNVAKHGHVLVFDMILETRAMDLNSANDSGETPLVLAARRGHKEIVKNILRKDPTVRDHKSTPLHAAAEHGHFDIAEMILPKMDVNSTNYAYKQSPLHLAVQGGHETVVDLLLGALNVNPSLKDSKSNTPLHYAAKAGNGVIFEKLLQIMPKVDVISPNKKGLTALHLAAKYKHANIVTTLLKVPNVDPCTKTKKDKTPLRMAAKFGGVDVVQVLLATQKVDVNITNSKKRTAIRWATKRGQLDVVEALLRVPTVVPCLGDDNDNTPLHLAAKFGHRDIAEILAVPHLDMVNKVNKQNETPLFLAAKRGSVDVVELLLKIPQVDLSICDHHGDSPFGIAVKQGHANIAEKLITPPRVVPVHSNKENPYLHLCIRGGHENLVDILLRQSTVDASAKDVDGNSPIHYAAQNGNTCILRKILNAPVPVDVNSVNDHHDTALHIAVRAGHVGVVDQLVGEPELNASVRNADGNCPLHVAALYDEEEIIEKLLKAKNADVNAKNEDGVTALVLAAAEGHVCFVKKLLEVQDILNSAKEGQKKPSKTDWGVRSLLLAARNGHHTIIKTLLEHGVNVNGTHPSVHSAVPGAVQGFRHNTALFEAIKHGRKKVVEELLKAPNIDPNRRNSRREHPLFIAARGGYKEIVEKLMGTGLIDVNVLSNGETALQGAAREGREQVVKILLKTPGIDVHIRNKNGETALFYAARADNRKILKDIYNASKVDVGSKKRTIQTHLNINDNNNEGDRIIHLAAREEFLNVIDFLLEVENDDAGSVNVNLETSPPKGEKDPQSALQIAIEAKRYSVVQKLTNFKSISFLKKGADGVTVLQHIFDKKEWETYKIIRRTEEVADHIEALYKDRQANVDAANAILVGAALIAGVTFASWLQPPLGYATYYHEQFSDSLPAPPIAYPEYAAFDHHPSLQAFWVFNSLSFFSAIATVISGARSILPVEKLFIKQQVHNLRRNLLKTSILLGFSMFFVLLAFATAGVVVLPPLMKFRTNIFVTIGIGGSVCFISLFLFGRKIYKLRSLIKGKQENNSGFFLAMLGF